jgi:hypothetical protein
MIKFVLCLFNNKLTSYYCIISIENGMPKISMLLSTLQFKDGLFSGKMKIVSELRPTVNLLLILINFGK